MENVDVKSEKSSEDVKETSTTPDASDPGSQSDSVTVQETVVSDAPEAEQVAIPAEATERAEDNAPDSEAVSADSVAMTEEMLQSSSSAASDDQLPDDNSTEPAVSADATEVSNVASGILSGFGVRFPRKPHNSPAESNSSTSDSGCATPEVSYGDGATTDNTEAGAAAAKPKSMGITVEDLSINAKVFKIIFLGDVGVGKTSIISRFCDGIFFHNYYKTTIGVDFRFRTMHLTENVSVRLHLYDLAGRECKTDLAKVYYRNSNGACIVFDESSTRDLRSVIAWKKQLDNTISLPNGKPIPCVLLGNKSDIAMTTIDDMTMNNFIISNKFSSFFQTSAKTGTGINEAIMYLIQKMVAIPRFRDEGVVTIPGEPQEPKHEKPGCAC